jgi:hypothetical protein
MPPNWGTQKDLAPFLSFVVLSRPERGTLAVIAEALEALLNNYNRHGRRKTFSGVRVSPTAAGDAAWFHYCETRSPSWLSKNASTPVKDVTHHLVLVYGTSSLLAIHCSEGAAAVEIVHEARAQPSFVPGMRPVKAAALERSLAWGAARTLWLGSVQRTSGLRADAKVLSGSDLTYALDPLEDQGYAFSSARCDRGNGSSGIVGVSPQRARVWSGPTDSLDSFTSEAQKLLRDVAKPQKLSTSFRDILATRHPARNVERAFEVAIRNPDLDNGASTETNANVVLRREWAEEATFDVTPLRNADFTLRVTGIPLSCELEGKLHHDQMEFTCAAGHTSPSDPCAAALKVLGNQYGTVVHYASGHTWTAGELYEMRLRPVAFDPKFAQIDVAKFDIREEKPRQAVKPPTKSSRPRDAKGRLVLAPTLDPARLLKNAPSAGRSKRSLFNWIVYERPSAILPKGGWLTCDDGSGERADFIHFDPNKRALRFIHVKACHSTGTSVSLVDFEQVVAQAVKNLRWFDMGELAGLMRTPSPNVAKLVWDPSGQHAKGREPRKLFANALEAPGHDYTRHVVVVQPGLGQKAWQTAAKKPHPDAHDLLSTLLCSARATCQGLNAKFEVVGRQP